LCVGFAGKEGRMQTRDDEQACAAGAGASERRTKRPYDAPKIRRLGAVRELTLGSEKSGRAEPVPPGTFKNHA
jgi:hypothetical protein